MNGDEKKGKLADRALIAARQTGHGFGFHVATPGDETRDQPSSAVTWQTDDSIKGDGHHFGMGAFQLTVFRRMAKNGGWPKMAGKSIVEALQGRKQNPDASEQADRKKGHERRARAGHDVGGSSSLVCSSSMDGTREA